MIRINLIFDEIVVTKDTKIINKFVPADARLLKDIQTFNGNGYEHELQLFETFPELIKYCKNYA